MERISEIMQPDDLSESSLHVWLPWQPLIYFNFIAPTSTLHGHLIVMEKNEEVLKRKVLQEISLCNHLNRT